MAIWDKTTGAPGAGPGKAWPDHGPGGKSVWEKDGSVKGGSYGHDHGGSGKEPNGKPDWGGTGRDRDHDMHDDVPYGPGWKGDGHGHGNGGWKDRDDDRQSWGWKDREHEHGHDRERDQGGWKDRDHDRPGSGRDKSWWDRDDHGGGEHEPGGGRDWHGGGRPPWWDETPDKDKCPPVPCFTPGTTIVTERGLVQVEDLSIGDLVVTRDDGLQPIRWIGRRGMTLADLQANDRLRPIRIRAGALGQGLPARDMMVSPQHRVLLADRTVALMFQDSEMLLPAHLMLGRDGVERMGPVPVTYIHILFDRHQVVLSDHIWTESFQPGRDVVDTMDAAQRDELYTLYPALAGDRIETVYPAVRSTLKGYEARALRLAV
jgi:hypothetical protein